MPRPARKPATPPKRKAIGTPAPGKKGTPASRQANRSTPPVAPFVRGGRLSLPDDEPSEPVEFEELTKVNNPLQRAFLQAFVRTPRISVACRAAGVSHVSAWKWRNNANDPAFLEAYEVARQLGIERAESEAWRRGVEGYEVPVYHQGKLVGTERAFSDGLMQFMLKGAKPETYRERFEHTGAGGGPIAVQLDADKLTDAEIAERIEKLRLSLIEPIKQLAATAVAAAVAAEVDKAKAAEEAYAQALAVRGNGKNGHGGNGQG